MNKQTLSRTISLLKSMNATAQQPWNDYHAQMYTAVMQGWEDTLVEAVMQKVFRTEEWRPTPARLCKIAVQIASPIPDDEDCYVEILATSTGGGLFSTPHPTKPGIYLEGPPAFSHPILSKIVESCGGWARICSGEANMQEGLRKQVRSSHESASSRWQEAVIAQLALPVSERNLRYFPTTEKPALVLTPAARKVAGDER